MAAKSGGGVQVPIFAFLAGSLLLMSALKGVSVVDVLAGVGGSPLDPGGSGRSAKEGDTSSAAPRSPGTHDVPTTGKITANGGAIGIVDQAATIARRAGGPTVYVSSAHRRGAITVNGTNSDHSWNDKNTAARDVAKRGVNTPSAEMDKAVKAVMDAFGQPYKEGQALNVFSFNYKGYRIQVIWRASGHYNHAHFGARKL